MLTSIFTDDFLAKHPVQTGTEPAQNQTSPTAQPYREAEEQEVKEQLRQLGYED